MIRGAFVHKICTNHYASHHEIPNLKALGKFYFQVSNVSCIVYFRFTKECQFESFKSDMLCERSSASRC